MRIRTLNKRRKRLNKYKMFLLAHMYSAIRTIKSKDSLEIEKKQQEIKEAVYRFLK